MDPKAEKYYNLSPCTWCARNPVKNVDFHGDTVAVLYKQDMIGHLALLIQNEKGKWMHYSYNGTNKYKSSNGKKGGKPYHDLGMQTFDSISEFLNSDYNKEGTEEEILIDKVNNFGYEKAFVIPTTHNQDKKIMEKFLKEAHLSYNLVYRQCAQVVQIALNAGGVKTTMMDFLYFDDYTPSESIPYMPISTFKAIQYNYPNGKIINIK